MSDSGLPPKGVRLSVAGVRLSAASVRAEMLRRGIGIEELKRAAHIKQGTWDNIKRERSIWMSSAKRIANVLTEGNLLKLYHPSILATLVADYGAAAVAPGLPDWEPTKPLSGCESASNGLQYYLWKLKHRFEDERFARGKYYDLSLLPTPEQDCLQNYLMRHGNVCNSITKHPLTKNHPRFLRHFTTTPDPQRRGWWVVDDWIEGRTLEETLRPGHREKLRLPQILGEIADGIQVLHDVKIIRRELSPRFILLERETNSVFLTDFELGKLFNGSPTTRGQNSYSPYRAPEAGGEITFDDRHVDLYSWGRIAIHAITGREPPKAGEEEREFRQVKLPTKVMEVVLRCVSLNPDERPKSVEEVQKAIRTWK